MIPAKTEEPSVNSPTTCASVAESLKAGQLDPNTILWFVPSLKTRFRCCCHPSGSSTATKPLTSTYMFGRYPHKYMASSTCVTAPWPMMKFTFGKSREA